MENNEATNYQKRVIEEKIELDGNLAKLSSFISASPVFLTLSVDERVRKKKKKKYMQEYSNILEERIAGFAFQQHAEEAQIRRWE